MSEVPESPQTRIETYLAGALGQAVVLPEPVTRLEQYLKAIAESGGGGGGLMPVIIYAESHTTVETYTVPVLTDTQITAAYNGIMAGKVVVVIDDTDTLAMQVFDASNDDGTAIRLIFTDKMILNYKEGGEIEPTLLAGGTAYSADAFIANYNADDSNVTATKDDDGKLVLEAEGGTAPVQSVNNKTGIVVLNASDILAQNSQSIQANLERIDDELAIRQVTMSINEWPTTLTEDFLYRITTAISHGGKTYEAGLYQVKDNDLVKIGEGGGAAWGSITGTLADQTDLQTALNGKQEEISDLDTIRSGAAAGAVAARSVNGNDSHVQEANEIYTTTSQSQTDAFAFRTAAGAMSINSGAATISTVYGNTIQTGHTDEVLNVTGNFQTDGTTVTLNKATWRGLSLEDGTYTFTYDGAWKLDGTMVVLADYGLTTSGTITNGDSISVEYVALVIGTLSTAKPTAFKATGYNQYNATAGYAHVVGGNQYRVAGTYTAVQFSTTPTGTKTPVIVENNKFTPAEDGYIFVTGSGNILVALVWSGTMDSEPWIAYSDNGFNVPTTDADGNNLPTATYGFPSVHGVRDEIDFAGKIYQQRIGHYAYSAQNLATVEALGVDYIYDLNDIFYVLPDMVAHTLASAVSGAYQVNDYGTEEWTGTNVPITTVITYGNSLVDKLRNLADIQSIGTGLTLSANGELSADGGGGSVNVVQSTGQSTTDVMSQKAVTDMVYSPVDVHGKTIRLGTTSGTPIDYGSQISIGDRSSVFNYYSIAMGFSTHAEANNSVAIGRGATATQVGQFDISTGSSATDGYNNSGYRLLTGLYDGQSAHDAATYGQLQALEARIAALEGNA